MPIDPHTGQPMTQEAWNQAITDFLQVVRNAFPGKQMVHNALWFVNGADPYDTYVGKEIAAADYVNLERGFADPGLTGDGGYWSIQHMFEFIDGVHAQGRSIIAHQYEDDGLFSLAAYFLINNGSDLFGNDAITPDNWPAKYDVQLGPASGGRYTWNNLIRRDFSGGMVLVNPPNTDSVTVNLNGRYLDLDGNPVYWLTLSARSGAVLIAASPSSGIPNGNHMLKNLLSGMLLDDTAESRNPGTQMIQWPDHGGANQSWNFASQGNGYYTLQNVASGLYLTSPTVMGWGVTQEDQRNDDSQLWYLEPSGSGYYLLNKATGWALANPQSSETQGTGMTVWSRGYPDQIWSVQ
jgi:hypothetical protein